MAKERAAGRARSAGRAARSRAEAMPGFLWFYELVYSFPLHVALRAIVW